MARKRARPSATEQRTLDLLQTTCRVCGSRLQMARHGHRKVTTLQGVYRLTLKLYRCQNRECPSDRQSGQHKQKPVHAPAPVVTASHRG